jgi:hypothetical protein
MLNIQISTLFSRTRGFGIGCLHSWGGFVYCRVPYYMYISTQIQSQHGLTCTFSQQLGSRGPGLARGEFDLL